MLPWTRLKSAPVLSPAILLLILILLPGCGSSHPPLIDTLESSMDQSNEYFVPDMRTIAPYIVGAFVLENKVVAEKQPAARDPEVFLDLHQVRCRKETIVRGTVPDEFTFYYFTQSATSPKNNPEYNIPFVADVDRRYIFFLMKERGVLRSIGDVGDYSVEIFGGKHSSSKAALSSDDPYSSDQIKLGEAITGILLTPGQDPDLWNWAVYLEDQLDIFRRGPVSRLYNFELLQQLLAAPAPVRDAACLELAESYFGPLECVHQVRDNPQAPQVLRDRATRISGWGHTNPDLRTLRDAEGLFTPGYGLPTTRREHWDNLQILLRYPDPQLSAQACIWIKRYFPGESCDLSESRLK